MSQVKTVIWPISPTESDPKLDQKVGDFLKTFSASLDLKIQPVYVLSAQFFATSDYFDPIDVTELKSNMLGECVRYLQENFSDIQWEKPVVLENHFNSQAAEVSLLTDYVDQESPDYVVLSSHGRSGWSRTFLGSFAESFLLKAKVPTVLVGPECEPIKNLKSALMPIQLTESSQKFVESFLDDHRLSFLGQLTLFHKISMVDVEEIAWAPALYGLGDFNSSDLLAKARETTEKYLQGFLDHPLSQKRLNYKVSEKLEAVSEVILSEAKDYDVIVMRSECGTVEANLLGSVTRDVIRQSTKPVVVYPHLFKLK